MVRLLTETGLRLEEACNLRRPGVDWTAGVATLRETKAGKTQHVPFNAEALAILRARTPQDADGYFFAWPDGRPCASGYVTHAFRDAAVDAGVKDPGGE